MLIGPVFTREAVTAPRRMKFYLSRAGYVAAFLVLMCTMWMVLAGTQDVRNVGDLARFGTIVFRIMATLQLAVVLFFSALSAASAVAQEKDRGTLVLLLMTRLTNSELVLGKLLAAMLNVLVLLAAAFPLFLLVTLFGGVSVGQIVRSFSVTLLAALAAGSLGSMLALWREKTFQTLALTALLLVCWLAGWEIVRLSLYDQSFAEYLAGCFSPAQAIVTASAPSAVEMDAGWFANSANVFLLVAAGLAGLLNLVAIWRVRVWNPSREARPRVEEEERPMSIFSEEAQLATNGEEGDAAPSTEPAAESAKTREVWDNPILWREMCTWAYGRKILAIKFAYLALAAACFAALYFLRGQGDISQGPLLAVVPLLVISLFLVNALAVVSLTNERDGRALDLLLVTDLTASEFIFGKLGGVFYNAKEMVLLPLLLCVYLWWLRIVTAEELLYLAAGLLVMNAFVAMLGLHTGMAYGNSKSAIAVSLGTVFFLFVGVYTCMRIMVSFGSFQGQLAPFMALVLGGGVGMYAALGVRNPSPAIGTAAIVCPFATFYAITSFMMDYTLGVFLVVLFTYGFTTAAMLVPALYEFDVATGRTTGAEE